jgi:hypothetical protein
MRIAIECFGGTRCCVRHKHIETFIETFPEIFNENNEIDFFILTTFNDWRGAVGANEDTIQYIKNVLGNKIKKFEIYEELNDEIKEKETQLYNEWLKLDNNVYLDDNDYNDFKNDIIKGFHLRQPKNLWTQSFIEELKTLEEQYTATKKIQLTTNIRDTFVRKLYYRKMLVNNMRIEYEKEYNIKYDWVIMSRLFDMCYPRKLKPLDFLKTFPEDKTVYAALEDFTAAKPEIINNIYTTIGNNYPVVGYEQWRNERFKKTFQSFDIGISFLRIGSTWCSENQILWQILQSCDKFINLRAEAHDPEHITDKNAYFVICTCNQRLT